MSKEVGKETMKIGDVKLFPELHSSMEIILNEKIRKKEEIEAVLMSLELQLSKVKSDTVREQSLFKQWKQQELQKFEDLKREQLAEITKKEYRLDLGLAEYDRNTADLEKRLKDVMKLEDERHAISMSRIDIENMMIEARNIAKEGKEKLDEAENKFQKISERESELKEEAKRLKDIEDAQNAVIEEYNKKNELMADEKKNLDEVRKNITPQLEEFKKLTNENKLQIAEIDSKTRLLNEKIVEEKHALDMLESEKAYIEKKKLELNQREDELKRRELLK